MSDDRLDKLSFSSALQQKCVVCGEERMAPGLFEGHSPQYWCNHILGDPECHGDPDNPCFYREAS